MKLLSKGKIVDNHMLAMVGMGGIGKTTLEVEDRKGSFESRT
jgi:predicted ATPase